MPPWIRSLQMVNIEIRKVGTLAWTWRVEYWLPDDPSRHACIGWTKTWRGANRKVWRFLAGRLRTSVRSAATIVVRPRNAPAAPAPEAAARLFHETYERLAPEFGYKTREASAKPWDQVPEQNRALMVATVREVLAVLGRQR